MHYIDIFLTLLKSDNTKLSEINELRLNYFYEEALRQYAEQYKTLIIDNPEKQIELAKKELEKVQKDWDEIEKDAGKYANKVLWISFGFAFTQWFGMGVCIFSLYGWEIMEPITYLVCISFL